MLLLKINDGILTMAEALPTGEPQVALYSGWGSNPNIRNQGDALCHWAASQLLEEAGFQGTFRDIRDSYAPTTEPWEGDAVIGGGTVLPAVFDSRKAPGLKAASRIFVFGSGCLNSNELDQVTHANIDPEPFARADVIGVRGPLSAAHYYEFFGKTVPYIGELAFALMPDKPIERRADDADPKVSFFLVENNRYPGREQSSLPEVISHYVTLASELDNEKSVFVNIEEAEATYGRYGLDRHFDEHIQVATPHDMIKAVTSSSMVITERLHAAVLAASHGVPFIYLQTTSKSRDFEKLLQAYSQEVIPSTSFVDLSRRIEPLIKSYRKVKQHAELPETLFTASSAIRASLRTAAEQLTSRLSEA